MAYPTFEEVLAELQAPPANTLTPAAPSNPEMNRVYWEQSAPLGEFLGDTFSAGMDQTFGLALGALEGVADEFDMDGVAEYLRVNRQQVEQSVADQLGSLAPADRLSMAKRFFPEAGEGGSAFADPRALAGQFMNTLPTIGAGILPAAVIGILGFPVAGAVAAGVASGALVGGSIWGEITDRIENSTDEELIASSAMYREFRQDFGMDEVEAKDALGDRVAGLAAGAGAGFSALTGGLAAKGLTSGITGAFGRKLFGREAAKGAAKAPGRSTVGRFGVGTGREALQESSEEAVEYGASRYGSESSGIPTPDIDESWRRGLAEAATGGAIYGGPTGGVMETLLGKRSGKFLPGRRNVVDDDQQQALEGNAAAQPDVQRGIPDSVQPEVDALGRIGANQRARMSRNPQRQPEPRPPLTSVDRRAAKTGGFPSAGQRGFGPDTPGSDQRIEAYQPPEGIPTAPTGEQTRAATAQEALARAMGEALGPELGQAKLNQYWSRISEVFGIVPGNGLEALVEMTTGRQSGEGLGGINLSDDVGVPVYLGDVANRAVQFLTGENIQTLPTAQHPFGGRRETPQQEFTEGEAASLTASTSDVAESTRALEQAFVADKEGFFGDAQKATLLSRIISDSGYILDRVEAAALAEEERALNEELAAEAEAIDTAAAGAPDRKVTRKRNALDRRANALAKKRVSQSKRATKRNARFDEAARAIDIARDVRTERAAQDAARAIGKLSAYLDKLAPGMLSLMAGYAGSGSDVFADQLSGMAQSIIDVRKAAAAEAESTSGSPAPIGEQRLSAAHAAGMSEEEYQEAIQAQQREDREAAAASRPKVDEAGEISVDMQQKGPIPSTTTPGKAASGVRAVDPETGELVAGKTKAKPKPKKAPAKKAAKAKATSKKRTAAKKAPVAKKAKRVSKAAKEAFPELVKAAKAVKAKAASKKRSEARKAAKKPVKATKAKPTKAKPTKAKPTKAAKTKSTRAADAKAVAALSMEKKAELLSLVYDVNVKGMVDRVTALDFALSDAGVLDPEAMKIKLATSIAEASASLEAEVTPEPAVEAAPEVDTGINERSPTAAALETKVNKALRSRTKLKPSYADTPQFREDAAALGYEIHEEGLFAYDRGTDAKPKLGAIPVFVGRIFTPGATKVKGTAAKKTSKARSKKRGATRNVTKGVMSNAFAKFAGIYNSDESTFITLIHLLTDQVNEVRKGQVTGGDLLRTIIATSKDPALLRIAKQLLPVVSQRPTTYRLSSESDNLEEGIAGQYRLARDGFTEVVFNSEVYNTGVKYDGRGEFLARDIIHEMLHDLASSRIDGDPKLRSEIRAIMQQLQDDPKVQEALRVLGADAYAFVDEHEFVSEVFADAGLRQLMHEIKARHQNKSMLERFTDAVVKMLRRMGIVRRKSDTDTLLDRFSKLRIIGSPNEIVAQDKQRVARIVGQSELEQLAAGKSVTAYTAGATLGQAFERTKEAAAATRENMGPVMGATVDRVGAAINWNNDFLQRNAGEFAGRGAKWMAATLPAMTRRQIVKAFGNLFERATGVNPLELFQRALSRKDALARAYQAEADKIYVVWEEMRKKFPDAMGLLNSVMTQSTMQGIYFSKDHHPRNDPRNAYLKRVKRDANGKIMKDAAGNSIRELPADVVEIMEVLHNDWQSLPDEVQDIYGTVLQYYADENAFVSHRLLERVFETYEMEGLLPPVTDKAATAAWFDKMREADALNDPAFDALGDGGKAVVKRMLALRNRPGPYFPLRRFGDYVVTADREMLYTHTDKLYDVELRDLQLEHPGMKSDLEQHTDEQGEIYYTGTLDFHEVNFFESAAEANVFRQSKLNDKLHRSENVSGVQLRKNLVMNNDAIPSSLMGSIETKIANDSRLKSESSKQLLRDVMRSAVLAYLPDASIRHAELRRKNIQGASHDMQRAFSQYALSSSHYKAQLSESRNVADAFNDAMDVSKELAKGPRANTNDTVKASRVMRELAMRMDRDMVQREPGKWIQFGSDVGFMWYLFNLSYPLINAMQPVMYTLPWLGAKYGGARSAAKMTSVYRVIGGKTMAELGKAAKKMSTLQSVTDQFNVIDDFLDNVSTHYGGENDPRFLRLKRMIDFLGAQGLIDLSFALDLRGGASRMQEEVAVGRSNWFGQLKEYSRILPHLVEIQNRFVTSIAAYELHMEKLARDRGVPVDKLNEADHTAAVKIAEDAVAETQFDYTASNKPRIMNPKNFEAMRLIMMFKQHPQHVYAMLIKYVSMAAGTDPEARSEARKAMLMLFGSHMFFAGALGAMWEPVKWGIGATLAVFGDDEDEDFDTLFRNTMADWFGQGAGEIISRGAPRAVGIDLSGRLGLGNMLFFDTPEASSRGVYGFIGEQVMGPVGGIGVGAVDAIDAFHRGDYFRALEKMSPKGLRDVLRAGRYGTEGMLDRYGNTIKSTKELGYAALFWQSVGLAPAAAAEAYEQRGAALGFERRVDARRSLLLERYARADRTGKREIWKEIREFNREHPAWRVTADTLKRSRKARARREKERSGAFYASPAHRRVLEEMGRFGNN